MISSRLISEQVALRFSSYPSTSRYILGFSGGLDSHVLLHLLCGLGQERFLKAVYIDHRLQRESVEWGQFCRAVCKEYSVEFEEIALNSAAIPQGNIESWARDMRYGFFSELMAQDDILLTAHHADDQAETVLLNLLRGTGPRGLAAMQGLRPFAKGWHARPLLLYSRAELNQYARSHQLSAVIDSSNDELQYERNFIRHTTLPKLAERWKGVRQTLIRVAKHQRAAVELMESIAQDDYQSISLDEGRTLAIDRLVRFARVRQINVIFYWLRKFKLPVPQSKQMDEIIRVVFKSRRSNPCISWRGVELRVYRGRIYAEMSISKSPVSLVLDWDCKQSLALPLGQLRCLSGAASSGRGIKLAADVLNRSVLTVRYRRGGERIQSKCGTYHIQLKKMFQDLGVLPWYRCFVPLLYLEDELIAVADFFVSQRFIATGEQESLELVWDRHDFVCTG